MSTNQSWSDEPALNTFLLAVAGVLAVTALAQYAPPTWLLVLTAAIITLFVGLRKWQRWKWLGPRLLAANVIIIFGVLLTDLLRSLRPGAFSIRSVIAPAQQTPVDMLSTLFGLYQRGENS